MKMKKEIGERKKERDSCKLLKAYATVLLVAIAIAFTSLAVTPVIAQEEKTEVTVNAPEYVEEGETFDVTIDVDYVEDFNAGQFDLSFDPEVVKVKKVSEGCIDDTEIPITMWDEIDSGTIRVMPMLPEDKGVSGSGYLALIKFKVKGDKGNECALEIDDEESFLGNITADEIPVKEWVGAEITVGTAKKEEEEEEEPPEIRAVPEEEVVSSEEGESMTFEITVDQRADISWQINGTEVQTDEDETGSIFTKSAEAGTWNVSAIVTSTETGLSSMHTWIWEVTAMETETETPAPEVTPTPTPTLAPGETPTPTPTPTRAPRETPKATSTPTPTITPTPAAAPTITPSPKPALTPPEKPPGFEAVFAIIGIVAIAYILRRRKEGRSE